MGNDDLLNEMWARWNHIEGSSFPWLREEVDPLTEALGRLIIVLDTIRLEAHVSSPSHGRGRPPEDRRALARAFVAKVVLGLPATSALIERLAVDKSLCRICGWERPSQVPSESTFSRAFVEFADRDLPDRMHAALIERTLGGRIVGASARDATEIEAREKPLKKPDEPPLLAGTSSQKKPGRPKKSEERPPPEPTRLERQATQTIEQMRAELPSACDVGTKKNSKGFKESWTGYKLHIDVACGQIPVSCILTSASVHNSQAAIPLMTLISTKCHYLYDLMDAAYDANAIAAQSKALGHVPLIDPNFRGKHDLKIERNTEAARRGLINIADLAAILYNFWTMAERINARLKDEFGGRSVRVSGAAKVKCHLMFGILALTVDQILRLNSPAAA